MITNRSSKYHNLWRVQLNQRRRMPIPRTWGLRLKWRRIIWRTPLMICGIVKKQLRRGRAGGSAATE